MDLSNATIVADFGSGIGTEGSVLQIDTDNKRLGIGTDNPQAILQVGTDVTVYGNTGIVSATYFYGDGSNITNTGSSLDAASGSQRVVVTSQTSGTMTAAATNGDLVFNASTDTLSAENVAIGGTLTYGDVTNVDSVGLITARTGLKVTAGGINAAGVVTATSFSGDGSNLDGVESGVVNFVASGTISNGATVIIKDDGTVGIVTQTTSPASAGTPVVYESANSGSARVTFDSTNGKVVVVYTDDGNSGHGTAIVGTVSGTSISFGTAVVFNASNTGEKACAFVGSGKVVVAWRGGSSDQYGYARVGTVSGTSISFGTAVVYASVTAYDSEVLYDSSNDKVVISYKDGSDSNKGKALVGTVSGTNISFGSIVTFEASGLGYSSATFDSTNNKVVVIYALSTVGKAIVGTVSGTSISFGTAVTFNSNVDARLACTFDSTNGKVVIAYRDAGNSNYITAIVGTVSGTSISFGTGVSIGVEGGFLGATYDSANDKVDLVYRDSSNSYYGTVIAGTVSGTSISFDSSIVFESASSWWDQATFDSTNNKVVITYADQSNSYYGKAVVFSNVSQTTNLTTKNYIGIAGESIANAATGKINVASGTNTGQSGLTTAKTYYVQGDGTLATSADTPSVIAGTSISDTKILVR